ncbi:MAG: T9SS type A sorting domain-containing protein [Flavobacteriales bacterium]
MKTSRTTRTARAWWQAGAFAAGLVAWCGWGGMEVRAQDPLWSIGSQQVHFPQAPAGVPGQSAIRTSPLPTSFSPLIPDEYEYQGQIAERTQNIQYDDEGKVLFYIIDGNIYNRDGLLIADDAQNMDDRDCEVCFLGGEEVHVVPVPGSCTRYFVMGLYFQDFERDIADIDRALLRWGVLDLSLESDLPVYATTCAKVTGRFLTAGERDEAPGITLQGSAWSPQEILPLNAPDNVASYLQEGTIYISVTEGTETLRAAGVMVDADGRHVFAVRCNQGLLFLEVDGSGIRKIPSPFIGQRWPFALDNGNVVTDLDRSQRGDLSVWYGDGELRVAWSSYRRYVEPLLNFQEVHQTRIGLWAFSLTLGNDVAVTSNITPQNVPAANPRVYSLDVYPVTDPSPVDNDGDPILRPAVPGVQFSPSGRYIYFVKSPDFAYPNSGGAASTFGYINLSWTLGDPGTYYTFLPIASNVETRKLVDSQLELNVAPDGVGTALYAIGSDAPDDFWMGVFVDPDQPDPANWTADIVQFPQVGSFTEPNSPATDFRFINRRNSLSSNLVSQQSSTCCSALTLAKDRSTTITEVCDLTWSPGDNAFWDTKEDIHVATELRIATGAHVTAQNMTFKFGQDAVFIIEPGASFTCTNCVLTNACEGTRWKGIEVHGSIVQNQFGSPTPTHQGMLVMRGTTVENAEIGVLVAKRGPFGNIAAGGVVSAERAWVTEEVDEQPTSFWRSTTFRNCRESVHFPPFQNVQPNGTLHRNLSRFNDCVFTVNDQYPVVYDFKHHVYMHRVDGIPFRACTFENALPDAFFAEGGASPGSLYLGHGIRSLDAHYTITSSCNTVLPVGALCPEADTRFSEFRGLDHGIHALASSKLRNFLVDRVKFTDNIAGVYSSAVVGYSLKNSIFSEGGRDVELTNQDELFWEQSHRGIYSHSSYAFTVEDNTFFRTPGSPADQLTEGVVIGYSRDHNDYVFRNHGENLSVGFAGEGISASMEPSYTPLIGLQLICNTNTNNDKNLSSRKANGATVNEQASHIIRTNQGNHYRPADNEFDEWVGQLFKRDYEVTTTFSPISYWHRDVSPYVPLSYDTFLNPAPVNTIPADNCASKLPPRIPVELPWGMAPGGLTDVLEAEKLAYGSTRYLYDQLIDGGNTDEVVQEITDAWPQEVWDLRNSLLSKSPYLSTTVLKELNHQNKLPAVLYAEVCIANPEATKAEGFYTWLEEGAPHPLPEYLLATIAASWEVRTYRTTLENTMADHHETMSQAATMLLEQISADSTGLRVSDLRTVWQEVRTPAARYAEALALMELGEYNAASAVVAAIPQEHDKLKARELTEKDRMLSLIGFMQNLAASGRSDAELTVGEQDQLETLIAGEQDRPGMWMQNLLCFHYDRCVAPWTGGSGEPKSLPAVKTVEDKAPALLSVFPNPATSWSVASLHVPKGTQEATLRVLDLSGKQLHMQVVPMEQPQLVLDTRRLAPGAYLVEVSSTNGVLATEKLIVQP